MSKTGSWKIPLAIALASGAMLLAGHRAAAADGPDSVTPLTMGAGLEETKEQTNLSGAACGPNGLCVLVGDEMRFARLFTLSPNAANPGGVTPGNPLYLLQGSKPNEPETDVEGVAFADGFFYIIGSHSRNKTAEYKPDRHVLYRIAAPDLTGPNPALGTETIVSSAVQRISLDSIIMAHPFENEHLFRAPGEGQHGLNIEGIAVRGKDMFLGFRGPVTGVGALILKVKMEELYSGIPQAPKAYSLPLGHGGGGDVTGQGVRDLAAVEGGYLILSGREMRVSPEQSDIFFWDPDGKRPVHLAKLPASSGNPESLTVLDENASGYRLLIMDDGPAGGAPRIVRVAKPAR